MTIFETHISTLKHSKATYNGIKLDQVYSNLPTNMAPSHKDEYMNNCIEVWRAENSGYTAESLKFRNFVLINHYLINH